MDAYLNDPEKYSKKYPEPKAPISKSAPKPAEIDEFFSKYAGRSILTL